MKEFLNSIGISLDSLMPIIFSVALIVLVMLIVRRLINKLFRHMAVKYPDGHPISGYLSPLRYVLLAILYILCGAAVAAEIPALNTLIKSLLAGSGIAAVVVGVASQDAVGNFMSGIIIRISKPFTVGDTIRYISSDTTGIVEEIGLRHTVIRTYENRRLIVPNSMINSSIIENASYGKDTKMSLFIEVGVTYESDINLAMELMAKAIAGSPSFYETRTPQQIVAGEPAVKVRINAFTESAVMLKAWIWAESIGTVPQTRSDMYLAVKQAFDLGGVSIAYPHVVIINNNDGDDASPSI